MLKQLPGSSNEVDRFHHVSIQYRYIYHMKYRSYLEWDIPSCIWIINHKPWIVIGMHIRAIFL